MIVVTGAGGFIAGHLLEALNAAGYRDLVLVDNFSTPWKLDRVRNVYYQELIDRRRFLRWLSHHGRGVHFVFHLGAKRRGPYRTLYRWNVEFSRRLWRQCIRRGIPLLYTSSATTYGRADGPLSDDLDALPHLRPTSPYGRTKHAFDRWAAAQSDAPYFWAGLKLMQVYGPGEGPPGTPASMVYKATQEAVCSGKITLFEGPAPDIPPGSMTRDFIYVKDVAAVMLHFMHHPEPAFSGIYNVGTGRGTSFNRMAHYVFQGLGQPPRIEYVPIPPHLRDHFPRRLVADIRRLRRSGFDRPFTAPQDGIVNYSNRLALLTQKKQSVLSQKNI